ncbi:hypothetical protein DY000_02003030 [Brassica cretica]|uniref:RING-type domain-containing protein n=1 Tax=Brassica cretica TaxID=69181 RepID=A0ABQ7C827_BRACR|nr:hypothetical protein DY000_02003030 [Brassica cretica]
MELDFDAGNLLEDEAGEVGHNDMAGFEGERCGICMDIIVDRGLLDCCQHWFCFECIDNWSSIMNLCPLCQREFQLITCVPVNDFGESSKVDEVSLSGDEDWCVEEDTDALSSPSHYIDENAVICLDGDLCKIRNTFNYIGGDSNLDTSIACDSCDTWYHAVCVGFDLEIASEDTWVCPRCLSSEKPLESDASPMETTKPLEIPESTNNGCSVEAIYSGNFSVTVADDGETALVVSTVKGDEWPMKPSDTTASLVQATVYGDPDNSGRKENTEQVPGKSELMQSLPHQLSSELPLESNQPLFAAQMETRADSQYALSLVASGRDIFAFCATVDPVIGLEEKGCLPVNVEKSLSSTAFSNSDVASVVSLKRKHSDCSRDDDNSKIKAEIAERLVKPTLEEMEEKATIQHESRSPSNNTTVDIFSIVKGFGSKKKPTLPNTTDKSSEGENAVGLRVKKIKKTPEDDKESLVLVEKLRKEIREAVRNKSMEDIRKDQFDPKLLAAFRAAVAGSKTDEAPRKIPALALKAKKLMLQKGKVRENLTKKVYADTNGKRKSAWHRDCEVEFWKHRCMKAGKPEKIETLKSVLSLLKKNPADTEKNVSAEAPQASNPILSRLYLADTSVFPRNHDIKPLVGSKETGMDKTLPKSSDVKGNNSNAAGSKINSGSKPPIFENPDELKKDKRKWALQVLARKKALAGSNSSEDKEGSPELKGNYPLLVCDSRPLLYSDDLAVLQALRAAGLVDSPPNSPNRSSEVPPDKEDSSLDKAREVVGPDNVLDTGSVPDTDIFGDFEYELDDEDYIGATKATKASEAHQDEGLTKVKVVLSTVQPEKVLNQSKVLGNEETTINQEGTTNGEEDGKSFVPMEPVPEAEGEGEGEGGEILSLTECEELYGPGTEKLVEKPLTEGSADNGLQAKAPDSECESNTHREFIASNFEKTSIQEKKLPTRIPNCNPSEKPSKEEKSKADGFSDSIIKKVEAYIKEHIRPLCKSGVINVDQYRWAVTKTREKVMKYHSKAKSANFLIKEGDKIKKLAEQYVETAASSSTGAHHKDKCK